MPIFMRLLLIVAWFIFSAAFAGGTVARWLHSPKQRTYYAPLPHHVPPHVGGVSFRFAMVHDIIHERYPKHGPAFYRERERLARQRLGQIRPETREAFDLTDDIGAGLVRLGQAPAAVRLLEEKLARQRAHAIPESELYTTYANLGTFMVEAHLEAMQRGDVDARIKVQQGRDFIAKGMAINPNAHFGREIWQRNLIDFLLQAQQTPELLQRFDFLGNRLTQKVPRGIHGTQPSLSYAYRSVVGSRRLMNQTLSPQNLEEVRDVMRRAVPTIGGLIDVAVDDNGPVADCDMVAFDEPLLGIIGMWRAGGGANPHFALALGETMAELGQRYLAWSCYERAHQLAPAFWPTPDAQLFLQTHCRERQQEIERSLRKTPDQLRQQFERELAYGQRYQREYQDYVETQIKAGVPLDAPAFFDAFNETHRPIATKPGSEEWYATVEPLDDFAPAMLVGRLLAGGIGVFGLALVALVIRWLQSPRGHVRPTTPPPGTSADERGTPNTE